jgi:RimJ/RimL family protein N-acetyltransferase
LAQGPDLVDDAGDMPSGLEEIRDQAAIERFLRCEPESHIYALGDLDPFFWPRTRWHGLRGDDGSLRALAVLYACPAIPTLLAFDTRRGPVHELLTAISPALPDRFYAHLTPGRVAALTPRYRSTLEERHLKLILRDRARLDRVNDSGVERLDAEDTPALLDFYARAYPGNWFDPRMVETGQYVGIRVKGRLVCAAGVHVYSPVMRVAALGNIATDPDFRRRGLARRAIACLCRALLGAVDLVGLNVHADNEAAIACYRELGFETVAEYEEALLERITG